MPISLRDNLLLALLQLEVLGLLRLQGELEGRLCILTRVKVLRGLFFKQLDKKKGLTAAAFSSPVESKP